MPLNSYQRFAYRVLGAGVEKTAASNVHLRLSLKKAHIHLRPEVYLAYSYLNMVLVFLAGVLLVSGLAVLLLLDVVRLPVALFVVLVPTPMVLAFIIYLLTFLLPDLRASSRARDIDARLPYALNYISTMASAGIPPERIFTSLAAQRIYGEVANEAAWISRDLNLLGRDLLGALSTAIDRSPSIKFQDFLQGAITALTSGEDLKTYFLSKSEQFVYENRQDQRRFLETLGVVAESYVTVVVAAPVLLIVLLSVMIMFGSDGKGVLTIGYILILFLLPLAMAGFGAAIKFLTPEV